MNLKTSELTGAALDWAVANTIGATDIRVYDDGSGFCCALDDVVFHATFSPSTNWSQGGPLIHTMCTSLEEVRDYEWTVQSVSFVGHGSTPLIAACRAIVAAKLGDTVEVPEGLV